jgi:amino acid transporter
LWSKSPDWLGFVFAWVVLVVVWSMASREVKGGTRLLLVTEALTIALILIVAVITLVKLIAGDSHGGFDMSVFTVAPGIDSSSLFLGVVFGFLSFAGFEAAATLGEETREPTRNLPRAILGTAIFGGLFFVVVTAIEIMGFGADEQGVEAFIKSEALIGDLAQRYVASWLGDVIVVGATFSAAACCLACVVGASRLIFALSRDGMGPTPLAKVHETRNVPHLSAAACVAVVAFVQALAWIAFRTKPFDLFLTSATAGTLILLVAYALATVGALKLLFFSGGRAVAMWEVAIPILGLALLGYTLYRNIIPWPSGGALWGPGLAAATLAAITIAVLAHPAAARRAGARLTRAEGLTADSNLR